MALVTIRAQVIKKEEQTMTQNTIEKANTTKQAVTLKVDDQPIHIIKRDGKVVDYQPEKIALAIKKAFDAVNNSQYQNNDVYRVHHTVTELIEQKDRIEIEEIQDTIEKTLLNFNYQDVYEAFSSYRDRRANSRQNFLSKQHKFLKSVEQLSIKDSGDVDEKRENANINGDGAMGMMLQYGSTISKQFSKSYLISKEFVDAHEEGTIHIHDMDFIPMGTTTCCQIDLEALFENGFSTGHGHLREPKDIASYSALAAIAIQSNQNDQHGGQSIPAFDHALSKGVVCTFRKQLKQMVSDYYDIHEETKDYQPIIEVINQIESLDSDFDEVKSIINDDKLTNKLIDKALAKTDRITYQAMEAFIHNLNTMHSRAGAQVPFSSINFGTDTSKAGRFVTKNYLLALEAGLGKNETPIFPIAVFKIKEGINYYEDDPNYDLFVLSCEVSAKRMFPNFSFLDSSFNKPYYQEGNYKTETTYMGCRTRVMADVTDPDNEVVTGRGNLSFTSINLPRLGLKHGLLSKHKSTDWDSFYEELNHLLEITKDQLLERLEIQKNKKVFNFPFLMGQGVWKNSKNLKATDRLGDLLNTGTLTVGFIGLAECLVAMIGEHHGESDYAQEKGVEIITHMRKVLDKYSKEYSLNFSLIATPAEGLSGRFVAIDQTIFGSIEGITDKDYYTNSFHVPVYYPISIEEKLKKEGPYHALTNAGHISYVELDGDTTNNVESFIEVVHMMKENDIGYGAINHPIDRDPVCGYTGIIEDVCPQCGRSEHQNEYNFERIRRITGYLVGTLDRFNNAKKAEEESRVKHTFSSHEN